MPDRTDAAGAAGIDPRGPRFTAGVTAVLLFLSVFLGLTGLSTARATDFVFVGAPPAFGDWAIAYASVAERALDPAFLVLLITSLLFLWALLSPRTAPWGFVSRRFVQPRLAPPAELEDPRPPRFAQGVGLFVGGVGLALHLAGVPWALVLAASVTFFAAFLSAAFGLCIGCQLYLLLQRVGLLGRARPSTA